MSEFSNLGSIVAERLPGWCKRDDSLVRCVAVNGVRRLNVNNSITTKALKELLLDSDPDVRIDAAFALGELEVTSSSEDLMHIITHDPVGESRIQATKALGKLGLEQVIEPLIDCIRNDGYPELEEYSDETGTNPCWQVQCEAIIALGEIASQRAAEPLINFINECDYEDIQDLGFRTLAKVDGERAHEYLHQQLNNGNQAAKARVIRALADIEHNGISAGQLSENLIGDLNQFLKDKDPDIRLNSARALSRFEHTDEALCQLLLDPEETVRHHAAEHIALSENHATLERLHEMLKITDVGSQQTIVSILAKIGNPESGLIMSELLANADGDLKLRLIRSIGLTANPEILPVLMESLSGESTNEFNLTLLVAISQLLSRLEIKADFDSIDAARQSLSAFIFNSDRMISTTALEAFAKCHDNPGEILLGFMQLDALEQVNSKENVDHIPVKDVTPAPEPLNAQSQSNIEHTGYSTDEILHVEEEQIPLDQFLSELPDDGDPSSSTLASIFARLPEDDSTATDITTRPDPQGALQWIPVHATRLLIEHADLNDELIDSLLEIAVSADNAMLVEIIAVFSRSNNARVLAFLEQCLNVSNREITLAALHALHALALPITDKPTIEDLLQSEDPVIREKSLSLLLANDGHLSEQLLKQAFEDNDHEVCITALQSISKDNVSEALRTTLFDLLMRSGGELTNPVAGVLRRIEDGEAIHWLLEKLNDENLGEYHWIFINTLTETYAPQGLSSG